MRAFQVDNFADGPQLAITQQPTPSKGEVLLKIDACGLNFADLLMTNGTYQDTPKPPFSLGMEVCGTVVSLGDGVDTPAIGSRVAVFGGSGGLAEFGVFPAAHCLTQRPCSACSLPPPSHSLQIHSWQILTTCENSHSA